MNSSSGTPRWETATMAGSFILIWVYFLARQSALQNGGSIPLVWNAVLMLAVVALVVVFVKRLKRTLQALREANPVRRK